MSARKQNRKGAHKRPASNPDARLIRLGAELRQQIEMSYSAWLVMVDARAPLTRKLDKLEKVNGLRDWQKVNAIRHAFDNTARGHKASLAYSNFNAAGNAVYKTTSAILKMQPHTLAGVAVMTVAGLHDGIAGFDSQLTSAAHAQLVRAICKAGRVTIPNGLRQVVRRSLPNR